MLIPVIDVDTIIAIIIVVRTTSPLYSSINETAKELGNVNRTLVAENLRGLSLLKFCFWVFNQKAFIMTYFIVLN